MFRIEQAIGVGCMTMALLLGGCVFYSDDVPGGRGDLEIGYDFDGLDCGAAGVSSVDVTVDGARYGWGKSVTLSCAPRYALIANMPEDSYSVHMDAYDDEGVLLYTLTTTVLVDAYATNVYSVTLDPALGSADIAWRFDGSASCGAVESVRVILVDPFDDTAEDDTYPCEQGHVVFRRLMTGDWLVALDGLGDTGQVLFTSDFSSFLVEAETRHDYTIDLEPY